MGELDYQGWFQPIPQSPVSRGFGAIGKAVDAVMERRRLQKEHEEQQRGLMERARMEDERNRQAAQLRADVDREQIAESQRSAKATALQAQQALAFQQQKARSDALVEADKLYKAGSEVQGQELMRNAGITREMNNIEDVPLEDMLEAPVAPRGPAGPTAEDMDEFERAGGPQAMQAEDANTQELYSRFGQQGLIGDDGTARPWLGPPTLALRSRRLEEATKGLRGKDPLTDDALDVMPKMVEGGAIPPDDASKFYSAAQGEIQQNKRSKEQAAAAASRARMERPMSAGQIATNARGDLQLALNQNDIKGSLQEINTAVNLTRIAELVEGGNWAAVGQLKGMFSKGSQGGTGVLTDKDLDVFWYSLHRAGVVESTLDSLREWYEHSPTPEKLAKIKEALASAEAGARARILGKQGQIADMMRTYDKTGHRLMRGTLGFGFPEIDEKEENDAIAAAKAAKAAKDKAAGGRK